MKLDGETVQMKYIIKRIPQHGPHPLWCVYEGDEIICGCTYLRGARNLVEHLCETDRRIKAILAVRQNFSLAVKA